MAMLELYLIRHGVAEERGKDWPDDSKRPLTSEGIQKLKKEGKASKLTEFVKVGDSVTVSYHDLGATKHASVIRVTASVVK